MRQLKEKTLLKLAIASSLIGIIALLAISENIEIKEGFMTAKDEDTIKLNGVVKTVRGNEKYTSMEIETIQTIAAIAFDEVEIEKGQTVEIIGEVKDKELIIEEIR